MSGFRSISLPSPEGSIWWDPWTNALGKLLFFLTLRWVRWVIGIALRSLNDHISFNMPSLFINSFKSAIKSIWNRLHVPPPSSFLFSLALTRLSFSLQFITTLPTFHHVSVSEKLENFSPPRTDAKSLALALCSYLQFVYLDKPLNTGSGTHCCSSSAGRVPSGFEGP